MKKYIRYNVFAVWCFILAFFSSCTSAKKEEAQSAAADSAKTQPTLAAAPAPHWKYTGEEGPASWGKLSAAYALCGEGKSQSPINIEGGGADGHPSWTREYATTSLTISHNEHPEEILNNGHTIQVSYDEGSKITLNGKSYALKQFHFHTPSEHTLNGKNLPMEMHLVHKSDDGSLSVLSVMFIEGKHNSSFDAIIKNLPNAPGEKKALANVIINVDQLLPKKNAAYHYVGSLTTPPCSEGVQWLVLRENVALSAAQIQEFSSRIKNNNRPTQPMNGRTVTVDKIQG